MADPNSLPETDPGAARAFAALLAPGEHVLWAGRPDARRFTRTDGRLVGLGIFWTAVAGAGFWGFTATLLSDDYSGLPVAARVLVLAVAALPFLVVAAYCLGGHVLLRRRVRARTAYAITTARVLLRRPAFRIAGPYLTRTLDRDAVGEVQIEAARHGAGTVDVHDARRVEDPLRLDTIAGAEAVAALLRAAPVQRAAGT